MIDGGNNGDTVYVRADNVRISGFKIINWKAETCTHRIDIRGDVADLGAEGTTADIVNVPNATGEGTMSWDAYNFPAFWHDLNNGVSSETLYTTESSINLVNR